MLIKWFEKLAAGENSADQGKIEKTGLCWSCTTMGIITFVAVIALIYWAIMSFAR